MFLLQSLSFTVKLMVICRIHSLAQAYMTCIYLHVFHKILDIVIRLTLKKQQSTTVFTYCKQIVDYEPSLISPPSEKRNRMRRKNGHTESGGAQPYFFFFSFYFASCSVD